jgi:transposase
MAAVIKGTLSKDIIDVLMRLSEEKRLSVKEVTLDMANNMELAAKTAFPNAELVTDRFHVVRLCMEALQYLRTTLRWIEVDKENAGIKEAKDAKTKYMNELKKHENNPHKQAQLIKKTDHSKHKYQAEILKNGDTPKQLLARSKYILAKKPDTWTQNQTERATILFEKHSELKHWYNETLAFRNIYEDTNKRSAKTRFMEWIKKVNENEMKIFYSVANTVENNLENILNFFTNRNTNANAESFNSKIKLFRANQRGVVDTTFFLFSVSKKTTVF